MLDAFWPIYERKVRVDTARLAEVARYFFNQRVWRIYRFHSAVFVNPGRKPAVRTIVWFLVRLRPGPFNLLGILVPILELITQLSERPSRPAMLDKPVSERLLIQSPADKRIGICHHYQHNARFNHS